MPRLVLDIYHGERGIDLAPWVARHGLWGVIVKCGGSDDSTWGRYEETTWVEQVTQAHALGLHVGAFYYSNATTTASALADAQHCVNECMRGMSIDMPIYIDIEERAQLDLPMWQLTKVVTTFCDYVRAAGYDAGIYSGYEGFHNMFEAGIADYSLWAAAWRTSWPIWAQGYDLWQEGSMSLDGTRYHRNEDVEGPGRIDLDWASDEFVARIEKGRDMPSNRLSYSLAAAEVMDHFVDHDAHGYSQPNRDGTADVETITLSDGTQVSFQGGDRDCSRLVQTCYVVVGALPRGLHMWTGTQREVLLANGFVEVPLDSLQRGDVLWRSGHTELYMGGGIEAGARRSETHGIDGRTGDQDGGEITSSAFVGSHWTSAYRCMKKRPGEGEPAQTTPQQPTQKEADMAPIFVRLDGDQTEHLFIPSTGTLHAIAHPDEKQALVKLYALAGIRLDMACHDLGSKDAPWGARANDVLMRGAEFAGCERFAKHPDVAKVVRDATSRIPQAVAELVTEQVAQSTCK